MTFAIRPASTEIVDLTDVDPPQFVGDDDPTLAIDMDEDSDLTIPIDSLEKRRHGADRQPLHARYGKR